MKVMTKIAAGNTIDQPYQAWALAKAVTINGSRNCAPLVGQASGVLRDDEDAHAVHEVIDVQHDGRHHVFVLFHDCLPPDMLLACKSSIKPKPSRLVFLQSRWLSSIIKG